ncbi:heme/hemin ABC transporter substrate-binding protein [Agromyces aureus]|uniref:Hemin receptor n=1 Tax=Agromyces aureus TaxID=453304 RepID=A0A191WJB7_9MICO|nr:ABC transporter substrate-binding protein [Agromyces aureus]ANJ28264.1 hemin receptor [Agromyces aureus]
MKRHRNARAALTTLAALVALSLAGCATPGAGTGAGASIDGASAEAECPGASTPFDQLELAADVRTIDGPSTACLADTSLPVIESDETSAVPLTVTGVDGVEVVVESTDRILPLDITGTIAATVFSLGLGDQVVGRDSSTGFAEAADLPEVTQEGHTLSAEAVLSLAPTVVITDTTLGPRDALAQLRDAGIPVVIVSKERSVENIGELVDQIAAALGVPERAELLKSAIDTELAAVTTPIEASIPADPADRPRMIFLYVRGSANVYYLFGEESGADSLIDAVGGFDVAGEIGWEGMRPVTAEALVQAAPDVVLVMTEGLASTGGVDGLLERLPALAATPAGEHRRIVDMADTEILGFGPRTPAVVDALARAVYAPAAAGAYTGNGSGSAEGTGE